MDNNPIVYVVDDDEAVRVSLKRLIESVGLSVQAFAEATEFLATYQPDQLGCLVLDVRMRGMSGLELQERLAEMNADLPIIFITGHADVPMAVRVMQAGAVDFIEKPFNDQVLLDRIQQSIADHVERRKTQRQWAGVHERLNRLTPRERQVLDLVLDGKANKEIAADLGVSCRAVEARRAKIMERMEVDSVAQLAQLVCLARAANGQPTIQP